MRIFSLLCASLVLLAAPLAAQIALPRLPLPPVGPALGDSLGALGEARAELQRTVEKLARDRLRTVERLVRANPDIIELDALGAPARRGELLVMDVPANALDPALQAGFTVLSREEVEGLGLSLLRVSVPAGLSLAEAQGALALLLPDAEIVADNLHFQAGVADSALASAASSASTGRSAPVGMIDGATGPSIAVAETRGFAKGAPYPSHHGSSVASLLQHAGAGTVRVADVYGTDKAGGNALAMAKGLGWLVERGSKVVTISLVGPRNALLERAVRAAQSRGVVVVAAVGNDGPATRLPRVLFRRRRGHRRRWQTPRPDRGGTGAQSRLCGAGRGYLRSQCEGQSDQAARNLLRHAARRGAGGESDGAGQRLAERARP